jgi:hypothetical protein
MEDSRRGAVAISGAQFQTNAINRNSNPSRDHIARLIMGVGVAWNLDALIQIKSANHEPLSTDEGSTNEAGRHLHSGGICISVEQSLFISLNILSKLLHRGYVRSYLEKVLASGRAIHGQSKMVQII